jgi:plastocyanin
MSNKFIIAFIVIMLGLMVGWYFLGGKTGAKKPIISIPGFPSQSKATPTPTGVYQFTEENLTGTPKVAGSVEEKGGIIISDTKPVTGNVTVNLTESGFAPKMVTIRIGTTITFTNNSSSAMWVQTSGQTLPGFDAGKSVAKGNTYSYTFTKVGSWKYTNHVLTSQTGTVIVTQ